MRTRSFLFILSSSFLFGMWCLFSVAHAAPLVFGRGFSVVVAPSEEKLTIIIDPGSSVIFDTPHTLSLKNPDRFVIDLPGLSLFRPQSVTIEGSLCIERIRSGQQKEGARIVIDLKKECGSTVSVAPDSKSISTVFFIKEGASSPLSLRREELPITSPQIVPPPVPSSSPATPQPPMALSIPQAALQPDKLLKFSVNKNFVSLEHNDRPLQDIVVVNKTDAPIFLRTAVERIVREEGTTGSAQETKEILASPRRFELPPLSSRPVRVVLASTRPEEGEHIYRVSLYPQENEFSDVEIAASVNNVASTVKVIAGLGVIVTVPSEHANAHVISEVEGSTVFFKNTGSRVAILDECSYCPMETRVCSPLPRRLLYPEDKVSLSLNGSGVVTCTQTVGKESSPVTVRYGDKEVH